MSHSTRTWGFSNVCCSLSCALLRRRRTKIHRIRGFLYANRWLSVAWLFCNTHYNLQILHPLIFSCSLLLKRPWTGSRFTDKVKEVQDRYPEYGSQKRPDWQFLPEAIQHCQKCVVSGGNCFEGELCYVFLMCVFLWPFREHTNIASTINANVAQYRMEHIFPFVFKMDRILIQYDDSEWAMNYVFNSLWRFFFTLKTSRVVIIRNQFYPTCQNGDLPDKKRWPADDLGNVFHWPTTIISADWCYRQRYNLKS